MVTTQTAERDAYTIQELADMTLTPYFQQPPVIITTRDLNVIKTALERAEAEFHNLPAGVCDRGVLDLIEQAQLVVRAAVANIVRSCGVQSTLDQNFAHGQLRDALTPTSTITPRSW